MTHEEHKARHKALHEAFDELLADYLRWNAGAHLTSTVLDLMVWSNKQTENPCEEDQADTVHVITVCAHCGQHVEDPETHMCAAEMMEHDR